MFLMVEALLGVEEPDSEADEGRVTAEDTEDREDMEDIDIDL